MTKIYYESDAELSVLDGQRVAVVGYSNQGRSWALNLRDSGLAVEVFARADASRDHWDSESRWRTVGLVAAGVDELRHAIGDRVEGLYGPCQWFDDGTDDPADGPNSEWFSHCYRDANGAEPPYPAAAAFAAGVVWQRCVKEAGTVESLPVLAASQRLDTTTLFGRFHVDPVTGVQAGHQIRVVQWRGGQRVVLDRPPRRA